jgi:hypothetical protein
MTTQLDTMEPETDILHEVAAKAIPDDKARQATFADLRRKPRRELAFTITTVDDDGEELEVRMVFRAINSPAYDALVAEHPPKRGKEKEQVYNVDTFAPALIAAVSHDPKLSYEQAYEIYHSDDWASGEIMSLFLNAQSVCGAGLDIPFRERA